MKTIGLIGICVLVLLVGCNNNYPETVGVSGVEMLPCDLNQTPTLFLYPAVDYLSEEPKFFDNTTYEILKDGQYLGKFKADRFNHSYLNLTYGDKLEMIISAKDDYCYVPKYVLIYTISYKPIQYINPGLECADKFKFMFIDDVGMPMLSGDKLNSNNYKITLDLETRDEGNFKYIGCSYDKGYIKSFELSDRDYNSFEPRRDILPYNIYNINELYPLSKENYVATFSVNENIYQPFNFFRS